MICIGLLVIGAGVGLAFTVSTGAVLGSVPADRAGAASAISETGLELGVALGGAIAERTGVPALFTAAGLVFGALGAFMCAAPSVRALDVPAPAAGGLQ